MRAIDGDFCQESLTTESFIFIALVGLAFADWIHYWEISVISEILLSENRIFHFFA